SAAEVDPVPATHVLGPPASLSMIAFQTVAKGPLTKVLRTLTLTTQDSRHPRSITVLRSSVLQNEWFLLLNVNVNRTDLRSADQRWAPRVAAGRTIGAQPRQRTVRPVRSRVRRKQCSEG